MSRNKLVIIVLALILITAYLLYDWYRGGSKSSNIVGDYKSASYLIEGKLVQIKDNVHYFGNDLRTDLDNDGREDVVFLITQDGGGSGTFYYAVAALNTLDGWKGSDGYFLGDRIAPQNINNSPNPRHKNVIVVNYADRKAGEPFTMRPSVGKSVYLKIDPVYMRWGIVEPDFEGESVL